MKKKNGDMNEQRSAVSGRKSCFLKTQNDLHYSLYSLQSTGKTAVWRRGEGAGTRRGHEKRKKPNNILLTDLKSESFQSFFMCSPRPL